MYKELHITTALAQLLTTKNKKMEKSIEYLRIFFRVSNIVFETARFINKVSGGKHAVTKVQTLHQFALDEIEKEEPDLAKIYLLLLEMERECETNLKNKPCK